MKTRRIRRGDDNDDDDDDNDYTNNNVFVANVVATIGVDDPGFECRQRQGILNNTFSINHALKFKYTPQEDKGERRINVQSCVA